MSSFIYVNSENKKGRYEAKENKTTRTKKMKDGTRMIIKKYENGVFKQMERRER